MRIIILFILIISIVDSLHAQAVVQIPVSLNDAWSKNSYKQITKNNQQIAAHQGLQALITNRTKNLIEDQNRELYVINPYLKNQKGLITNYIENHCKRYIRFKYPAISKVAGVKNSPKNLIIRNRLIKKCNKERQMVSDYLEPKNYMTEGKRLFLTLNLLENLIDITLENETY